MSEKDEAMKCRDCGKSPYEPSRRWDICIECFDLRTEFVRFCKTSSLCADEFNEVQRVIQAGKGQGANAMRRVMGLGEEL